MKSSSIRIIAAVLTILLLATIGIYGHFVVNAQSYDEVWEPVKKNKSKEKTATNKTAETKTKSTGVEAETISAESAKATEEKAASSEPTEAAASSTAAVSTQPVAVIVPERKKDVTPKTADLSVENQYLICMALIMAAISILLLSVKKETLVLLSEASMRTHEKRRWEKAWEECKKIQQKTDLN